MAERLQFNVRRMLAATMWLAICGGAFGMLRQEFHYHNTLNLPWFCWPIVGALFVVAPFVAAGTLFGRPGFGFVLGMVVLFLSAWVFLPRIE